MALKGIKVLEISGLAPAPFCGLLLSDFGAEVLRIDRPHNSQPDCLKRGKKTILVDLKADKGKEIFKKLSNSADVLIEPFRPGVMEKLSLGPNQLMSTNQRLVFARLSGYGQTGPMAKKAGHDINYLSIAGILSKLGTAKQPAPPINILGDFAGLYIELTRIQFKCNTTFDPMFVVRGGGLLCALGICMALLERHRSGRGQIVDQSITEGTAYVSSFIWKSMDSEGYPMRDMMWPNPQQREGNLLDGGSPAYGCYRTKDNKYMSVGALEPQFYDRFATALGLDPNKYSRYDVNDWKGLRDEIQSIFEGKTQSEWSELFDGVDACVTPVLDLESAHNHEQNRSRNAFFSDGTPKPSPILSRTPAVPESGDCKVITKELLLKMGYSESEVMDLAKDNVIEVEDNLSKITKSLL